MEDGTITGFHYRQPLKIYGTPISAAYAPKMTVDLSSKGDLAQFKQGGISMGDYNANFRGVHMKSIFIIPGTLLVERNENKN